MPSFIKHYRAMYQVLGYPLSETAGLSSEELAAAERRLGIRIPAALRDYYIVAGRERRFNTCLNRLLSPTRWTVDAHRLIFMEENQQVVYWGVSTRKPKSDDPPVSQGVNSEPVAWYPEHRKCSVFLAVMLHYHAANGGYRFCGSCDAPEQTNYRFEDHGWTYHGKVNSMSAYNRQNQVVCLMPPGDLPFMQRWKVLAGGKQKTDLESLARELEVSFDC